VATPWCNDSCRNSRTAPDSTRCSCGVNCGVQPRGVTTRVVIRGRPAPCAELACCGRPRPRVVIVVTTTGFNHWVQPRAVIRGRRRTRTRCSCVVTTTGFNHWVKTRVVTRGGAPDSTRCSCAELARCGRPRPRVVIDGSNCVVTTTGFNHWVKTRVAIRGRTPPNSFNTMKGRRFI